MSSLTTSATMAQLNSGFDADIDSFLDFDDKAFTSTAISPDLSKGKAVVSQRPALSASSSTSYASSQSQQTFSGPSFQYDSYRQQTGLPVGGLANTFALNQASGMQYTGSHHGFVMPTETLNMPLSNLEDFDFGRNGSVDMDMEFEDDSPLESLPAMFYPSSSSGRGFVNPTALVGQDKSPTYPAPIQRMYPGMHTQQAAQAKAQQAQKEQEMQRQQQQPRQVPGQKSLPSQQKAQTQKDPHVEESISRLLHQMRQNSVASVDDDAATPTGNMPNLARLKKDEEDMDEDERLLASEEGKKLSSKERRQLRNKVSARAFRSRRKEYIGQLEGEVAVKTQEANDLKAQNRQLMEENTRLTDLTRMLLSSPAFSSFLDELSQTGMPATTSPAAKTSTQSQPQPQPTRKDVNPHQAARQIQNQQAQVGMAMIPESAVDFSMLEVRPSINFSALNAINNFQVCSVMDVPEGPVIDVAALSDKSSSRVESFDTSVKELPAVEALPSFQTQVKTVTPSTTEVPEVEDIEFPLFSNISTPAASTTNDLVTPPTSEKDLAQLRLVICDSETPASRLAKLKHTCALMDAGFDRLAAFTAHMQ